MSPKLTVVPNETFDDNPQSLPAKTAATVSTVRPELIDFQDEESFRRARREWELLVMGDKELTTTERLVALRLATHAGPHAFPFPSAQTIATDLAISLRTVQGAISKVTRRGWFVTIGRIHFNGPTARALSVDPDIASEVRRRIEGNKISRDITRRMRMLGERL